MQLIFQESIRIANDASDKNKKSRNKENTGSMNNHGGKTNNTPSIEKDVIADTTVQEKNITYPTDDKLYKKIISNCVKISEKEEIKIRQNYKRKIQKLSYQQRFKKSKKQIHLARKAGRKIKTIAGRLVRELLRRLKPSQLEKYLYQLELFNKVLHQKREDKNKVYSLHEPQTECISKGKAHKKYEFGNKVSIIIGKETGIVLGALSLEKTITMDIHYREH